MKTFFNRILFTCISALLVVTGCKKDKELNHTQVSEVKNLFAPENNKYVKLEPASGSLVFEWEQARAEDNGLVLYEVLFDKEDGDFSKPLYSVSSDNNGLYNKLSMSYADLNKVANAAGIQPLGTGKVKWTVVSSKGINVQNSSVSNVLELERPAGFTEIPAQLYLTGSATESGDDLSKAIPFKQVSNGVFEVYTSLKDGTYTFAERNTGTPATYSLNGDKMQEGGSTTVSGDAKVYRISLNFNNASATVTEIISVGLWFSADNKIWYDLPYTGNSTWEIDNAAVVFHQEDWGRDERYKFKFTVKDASGAESAEWFGSKNRDNGRPDAGTPLSYWEMYPVDNSQYDYTFKFNGDADNKNADIKVDFNASGAYTHSVTIK
ncbi:SusE domain-containing protein [Rubrolithibacter danxiaensis]|uniref:SusE domain-containing protein n=1 Tax=Rubrolithibacter danxiaensis TaxID=3390805 RepID=UPI003BF8CF4A